MPTPDNEPEYPGPEPEFSARANLRDHPSTVLVVLLAVGSAMAWTLHKWLGRRGATRPAPKGSPKSDAAPPRVAPGRPGNEEAE